MRHGEKKSEKEEKKLQRKCKGKKEEGKECMKKKGRNKRGGRQLFDKREVYGLIKGIIRPFIYKNAIIKPSL